MRSHRYRTKRSLTKSNKNRYFGCQHYKCLIKNTLILLCWFRSPTHWGSTTKARGLDHTPDNSGSLAKQKTIEAPQAILTLGKHGGRTAEMFYESQLKRIAGKGSDKKAKPAKFPGSINELLLWIYHRLAID